MATRSSRMVVWGAVVLVMGLCSVLVESQAQCAGSDLTKLYACLSAAKADVTPSAACCQGLGSFNSDAGTACLCAASSDPRFTSAGGKPQFAALIPRKCNLRYKAGIKCNGEYIVIASTDSNSKYVPKLWFHLRVQNWAMFVTLAVFTLTIALPICKISPQI